MDFLNIRYVKLRFVLGFLEDATLPVYKTSTIRGGIGEMLMRQHCINQRICDKKEQICEYARECIVQRMMYASPGSLRPEFMGTGDSVGYVIECTDGRTNFPKDSTLSFQLLLFGKNIVYFNEYLQAIHLLGAEGLGKEEAKYRIEGIFNQKGESLLSGNHILLDVYRAEFVSDYAARRREELLQMGNSYQIQFKSPVSIKYRGEFIRTFQENALKESLLRRIYILNCFEGRTEKLPEPDAEFPLIISQDVRWKEIPRYSFRNQEKIRLKGILGTICVKDVSEEWLTLLCAGELIHIGKSVTFGFGQYRVTENINI